MEYPQQAPAALRSCMSVAHPLEISTETCCFLSFLESSDHHDQLIIHGLINHQAPDIVTRIPITSKGLIRINTVIIIFAFLEIIHGATKRHI